MFLQLQHSLILLSVCQIWKTDRVSTYRLDGNGEICYCLFAKCALLFVTPQTAAHQAPLSSSISQSLLRFMSIESMMLCSYLIICHPLLLLLSIFPSIRVFSNGSALCIRWSKQWCFSFSIRPSNEYSGLISFQSKGLSGVFSSTRIQKHQFFGPQPSL